MKLHILNGDATAFVFKSTGIEGEVLIWREILSEGPAFILDSEKLFWKLRASYIVEVSPDTTEMYYEKVVAEVNRLELASQYEEIVLWFEHDLCCQINLVWILQKLYSVSSDLNISVVSINKHPAHPDFKGLGELKPEELAALYPNRRTFTIEMQLLAKRIWEAYAHPNPWKIQDIQAEELPGFPFMQEALLAHLQRFPYKRTGLNRIEENLLEIIAGDANELPEIMSAFQERNSIYGMGDLQIIEYLDALSKTKVPLVMLKDGKYELTADAYRIPAGDLICVPTLRWAGGTYLLGYYSYWDEDLKRVVNK